ncbi:helix-turn-helix transcriptional regulator [Kitasatospora viridis]|uniref:Helix-turn-helix protein n=1 Tax=Kitasatospora viridis TaxID=281105 RepID=A0A561UIU5_9ACTN|nr:helix-turn-helix transcriptional regulator [Kitasatospora viridis]TWF99276.1 helix-turn-helix protein [Kitasatospora viridis]
MENALGEFLRSRRARIQPEEVGLPAYGRRRVPGLRREEVAMLAGVSVDYYVRLEQGRGAGVSEAVLDAVARVLRLDPVEHDHLRLLVHPPRPDAAPGQTVRPGIRLLMDRMAEVPVFVLGRRMDVLAWNGLADAVVGFGAMERCNAAWHTFCAPSAREFYPQWAAVAAETVGYLRLDAGRHPGDPELAELVAELSARSPEFREMWADHQVREKTWGRKLFHHSVVGELELGYETLQLPGDPDQLLVAYTVEPGSATEQRLALLANANASASASASASLVRAGGGAR